MIKNKMSLKTLLREQPKDIEDIILSYYDDLMIEDCRLEHQTKMELVSVEWYCRERHYYHPDAFPSTCLYHNRSSPCIIPKYPTNRCLDYFSDKLLVMLCYYHGTRHECYIQGLKQKKIAKNKTRREVIHLILKSASTEFNVVYFSDEHPLPINI